MNLLSRNVSPFYVSDSFTLVLQGTGPAPYTQIFNPGVANQDLAISRGRNFRVYIFSASFVAIPFSSLSENQGINFDIMIGLYDLSLSPPIFTQQIGFATPYGAANNGQIINASISLSGKNSPNVSRHFGTDFPLVLGGIAPSPKYGDPGLVYGKDGLVYGAGPYEVGAHFQFNFGTAGPITLEYDYHLHGAVEVL